MQQSNEKPQGQNPNCYERMKKLLILPDDNRNEIIQKEETFLKAMQVEAKINQMERQLKQKTINNFFKTSKENRIKKHQLKSKTQYLSFKPTMLQNLRQKGYQRFFEFQKLKKQTNMQKIKSVIGDEIDSKFSKVLNNKDMQRQKLHEQNRLLQRTMLQKNVQVQILREQTIYLKKRMSEMQQKICGARSEQENAGLIASYQKWQSEYKQHFGQMSISQLSRYIDSIKLKCLQKFDLVENRNHDKLMEVTLQNDERYNSLKKEIQKLQKRENQLLQLNRSLKLNRQVSSLQFNELQCTKTQLTKMQQLIISLYAQWYQKRTDNQKELLKNLNKLKQNYSYQDMLNYIVFYDTKLSTNDKLNQYILKILRGIQKIRKLIYPIETNQKLDPFIVVEKIEKWVQYSIRKNRNAQKQKIYTKTKANLKEKEIEKNKVYFEQIK